MANFIFAFFLFSVVLLASQAMVLKKDDLVVKLAKPEGKIRGHMLQTIKGNPIYAFQDIPYAKPPIGENRLQLPQPLDNWDGIINTTTNTKMCVQIQKGEEDCLVLNVYSPVKPGSKANLSVLFAIHGGGYQFGDGGAINESPALFLDYPIVFVSVNYRLGLLGFLTTNDRVIPANLALKDQQFALRWTIDNIHLFGGDPKKITVQGESAGGTSSGYHLLSKQNEGLIKGLIQQSGTAIATWAYQPSPAQTAFAAAKLIDSSFNSTDSSELLKFLQNAPLSKIRTVSSTMPILFSEGFIEDLVWTPVIEDDLDPDAFVTGLNLENLMNGNFNLVPLLIGFCSEESLFKLPSVPELEDLAKKHDADPSLLLSKNFNIDPKLTKKAGLEIKKLYSKSFQKDLGALIRYTTDSAFIRPIVHQAEVASKHVPTYLFEFSYSTDKVAIPGTENVRHGGDMLYLFRNQTVNEVVRSRMVKLWSNFILHQNPTPVTDKELQNIKWPTVKPDKLQYLNINGTLKLEKKPRNYFAMKKIVNKYRQPPYITY